MNHITLETAKKLHQLGFTRDTAFMWCMYEEGDDYEVQYASGYDWSDYPIYAISKDKVPAPTCEELLEVLHEVLPNFEIKIELYNVHNIPEPERSGYSVHIRDPLGLTMRDERVCSRKVAAEALALLLIELVKQGIVDKDSLTDKK